MDGDEKQRKKIEIKMNFNGGYCCVKQNIFGFTLTANATNDDIVTSVTGHVFVAETPEQFTYDDDGNMLTDGRFSYEWDGENRLVSVETLPGLPMDVPVVHVAFDYDYMSRRVGKTVYEWDDGSTNWLEIESRKNVFNGWALMREEVSGAAVTTNWYVHGLDLSGSLSGAGGVGGLLAATLGTNAVSYTYCANGNVSELIDSTGNISAHYEYSPFGETIVATGSLAKENKFRFSTKSADDYTKLVLYEYRAYSPGMGRFISRDPIGEDGGLNLYHFAKLPNAVEYLGLTIMEWPLVTPEVRTVNPCIPRYGRFGWRHGVAFNCNGAFGVSHSAVEIRMYWYAGNLGYDSATAKLMEKQHHDNAKNFYETIVALLKSHDGYWYGTACECAKRGKSYTDLWRKMEQAYDARELALDKLFHEPIARRIRIRNCDE